MGESTMTKEEKKALKAEKKARKAAEAGVGEEVDEKAAKKAKKSAKKAKKEADGENVESPTPAKKAKKESAEEATPSKDAEMSEEDAKAAKKAKKAAKKAAKEAAAEKEEAAPAKEEAAAAPAEEKAAAAAPAGEGDVKSVFCTNLSWSIDDAALTSHFASAGTVTSIKWIEDRDTGRFKGMGVAEFETAAQAQKAVEACNETEVAGRTMYCRLDNPKPKSDKPKREPRPLKPKPEGGCKLYCGNLSYDIDDAAVRAFFDPLTLNSIRWVTDRNSGDFKGCGFVEFATTEEADSGMAKQGEQLMGRAIRLDWAEDKPKSW
jgi:RNA recognition motif-containing protein